MHRLLTPRTPAPAARLLAVLLLTCTLAACDSNDDDGGDLDGDLSVRVEGASGLTIFVSPTYVRGTSIDAESTSETIPSSGVFEMDLEDGAEGIQVDVTVDGGEDLTLQLLSDGDVIEEDTTPEPFDNPAFDTDVYTVQAGREIPFPGG